jgi:hypothetical protein
VRDGRSRRVLVAGGDHYLDAVGGEHFERGGEGRRRQRVRIEPRNSGPVMPLWWRCTQIAWLIAATWASLKLPSKDTPRCPEVPKATRCARFAGSGRSL